MKSIAFLPEREHATAFAKAMAQNEFGRFYWDELREQELRRSLATAMARVKKDRRERAKLEKRKK
jgi:hypothetical protein